jgi:magnesium-transporting ATPase (P-type)
MEIDKKLRMMRFWLAGTVIIVIGMVSIVSYFLTNTVGNMTAEALGDAAVSGNEGMAVFSTPQYWMTVAIAIVLSVAWYYIYKAFLGRQE